MHKQWMKQKSNLVKQSVWEESVFVLRHSALYSCDDDKKKRARPAQRNTEAVCGAVEYHDIVTVKTIKILSCWKKNFQVLFYVIKT